MRCHMSKTYRSVLRNELQSRIAKNSYYSLRAFARDLEISPSRLSESINGVRGISLPAAEKICKKINLNEEWTKFFLTSVLAEHSRNRKVKNQAKQQLEDLIAKTFKEDNSFEIPKTDYLVAWYYLPVLRLLESQIRDFKEISQVLDIAEDQVEQAFRYLKRLGFIGKDKKKADLSQKGHGRDLNINQEQILEFSKQAFRKDSLKKYALNEVVFLEEEQLKEAKRILSRCCRELRKLHQDKKPKNASLFYVNLQLFEQIKIKTKKGK